MKKKPLAVLTIITLILVPLLSRGQTYQWLATGYGNPDGVAATDKYGNAYLAGDFSSNLIFGKDTLQYGGYIKSYLVKYDSSGKLLWAVQSKGPSNSTCEVFSLAIDNSGNTFITGEIQDTVFLGPYTLMNSNPPSSCAFIAKYDKNGNILWAKQAPSYNGLTTSVAIDLSGNALITGVFADTIAFGSIILRDSGWGIFTAKYDPNGNILWAKQSLGQVSDFFSRISTDNSGNSYITSWFYDSATFGSIKLKGPYNRNTLLLVKYDPSGNVIWAKQSYTISTNGSAQGCAITKSRNNDFYVAGSFTDTVLIGSDTITSLKPSQGDIFIAKYDSSGNVIWVKSGTVLDSNYWLPFNISADTVNRFYITCGTYDAQYTGHTTCKIKLGTDTFLLNDNPIYDGASILAEFDSSGRILCGDIIPAGEPDGGAFVLNNLVTDASGKYVYLGGSAMGDNLVFGAYTVSGWNGYLAKWQPCEDVLGIENLSQKVANVIVYPNPNRGMFTIGLSGLIGKTSVVIYDILGEQIYKANLYDTNTQIDLSNYASGIYLYRILTETTSIVSTGKLIIQK